MHPVVASLIGSKHAITGAVGGIIGSVLAIYGRIVAIKKIE